ncbi:ABC transporter ATP-binding protein [Alkalihalobacillus sp. LMS39]|uniref:ABC transporter ATP-binding protein n=1 Tax=Alkalihalobacillus sp. LMS39 TaxID=2924032 RepID=UPI001FB3F5B5|nr:ABC transporter ATP-binding protein [Alkalihalobacillus sp. LMS39]UOE93022.1 ABC transporter ATP-binding protein [Alkalihalobacillus sp. LMS39]
MNNTPLLSFHQLSFSYPQKKAEQSQIVLKDLSFTIQQGEFVSILGPSGSGKSTIFRLITGLEKQITGDITFQTETNGNRLGKVGLMPQQDMLLEWRTVLDNVILPLEVSGKSKKEAKEIALSFFPSFGLQGTEKKYPHQLSGGMKQRASFLRAMLGGSELLLLDEPFSSLDAMTKLTMQEWLLAKWDELNSTILFITHDVDEALFLSDRIILFTETPLTTFEEISLPLRRPRSIDDLLTQELTELKRSILNRLRQKVSV